MPTGMHLFMGHCYICIPDNDKCRWDGDVMPVEDPRIKELGWQGDNTSIAPEMAGGAATAAAALTL